MSTYSTTGPGKMSSALQNYRTKMQDRATNNTGHIM